MLFLTDVDHVSFEKANKLMDELASLILSDSNN